VDAQKPGAENKDETMKEGEGAGTPTDAANGDTKSEDKKDQVSPQNFPTFIQCCGSRMFIPNPVFYPYQIPDPTTATKEKGEKNLLSCLFCKHKHHKIENHYIFELVKRKIRAIIRRILVPYFLPKKLAQSSQKYGFRIRDLDKTYSKSRILGSNRHRMPDPDPQHCFIV
jgi:hypothetical protein